jgi:hypothetical protein
MTWVEVRNLREAPTNRRCDGRMTERLASAGRDRRPTPCRWTVTATEPDAVRCRYRCRCRCRWFSETRVAEPVIAEGGVTCRRPKRSRRNGWHRSRGSRRHALRCAVSRAQHGARITHPAEHETSRSADGRRRGNDGRVPGIRRSPVGRRQAFLFQRCPAPARAIRSTRWRRPKVAEITRAGERPTPPQGGEPERRRDQRRTRRQAGATENPVPRSFLIRDRFGVGSRSPDTDRNAPEDQELRQRQGQGQASSRTEAFPVLSNDVAAPW